MKKNLLIYALGAASMLGAANPRFVTPLCARSAAPVVDGVLHEKEWQHSVRIGGFLQRPDLLASNGEALVNLACDGTKLYIGIRMPANTFDPDGGLKTLAKARDSAVFDDDSVEVVLVPDTAKGKEIYHFVFNANSAIFDMLRNAQGLPNFKWNCPGLEVASKITSGWWEMEIGIPLSEVGAPRQRFTMNVCRNFEGGIFSGLLGSSAYEGGPKFDLVWGKNYPAIQQTSLGTPRTGNWHPAIKIAQAPAGKKYVADLELLEFSPQQPSGTSVLLKMQTLKSGEALSAKRITWSRNKHQLVINVRDGQTGENIYSRKLVAVRGRKADSIPATAEFDLIGVGSGTICYYPSLNQARISFATAPEPEFPITQMTLFLAGQALKLNSQNNFNGLISVPGKVGKYPMAVQVRGKNGQLRNFERVYTFEKKHFAWENNQIGKAKIILPPFTALKRQGNKIDMLLRNYEFNGAGLLQSFHAMNREMLAAPCFYELQTTRGVLKFQGNTPEIKLLDQGYAAEINSQATAPDGTVIAVKGKLDYDGFMWNKLHFKQVKSGIIQRFSLIIPLRDREVPLFHIATMDNIRNNPTGKIPAGEGLVWGGDQLYRSTSFLDTMSEPQTVPYVWLGSTRRGLSYFINNTCGMKLAPKKPAVRLVRRGGVMNLEIDFINRPVTVKAGHALAFGWQGTPVKSPDAALRRHFQSGVPEAPQGMTLRFSMYTQLAGIWAWMKTPFRQDWSLWDSYVNVLKTGRGQEKYRQAQVQWDQRHEQAVIKSCQAWRKVDNMPYYKWLKKCRNGVTRMLDQLNQPTYVMQYSDPTLCWNQDEALNYFKAEWVSQNTNYEGCMRTFLTPSYLNYILHCYHEALKHQLQGIYFDDMFPMTCRNADTAAQKDDTGKVHGNFGILEMRELVRRTAVMQHQLGIAPRFIQIHMTNCLLVPCFAFANSILSWEDHYGEDEFQKRFKIDYIMAESTGAQIGAEGVALDGIFRRKTPPRQWMPRFAYLTRTQMALLLPTGVKIWRRITGPDGGVHRDTLLGIYQVLSDFKIWDKACQFVAFYDDDHAIWAPEGVLVGSYRRPGQTLVIFGNSEGKTKTFKLKFDAKVLGLSDNCQLINAETHQVLSDNTIKLNGYDLAMILIKQQ